METNLNCELIKGLWNVHFQKLRRMSSRCSTSARQATFPSKYQFTFITVSLVHAMIPNFVQQINICYNVACGLPWRHLYGFAPAVNGSRRMYTDRAVQPISSLGS
ncbi:hypothetical protein T06_1325 [Trichinella sp. T6]|nr:hypothetical protein T06_1325 [Trichinella sp. T6]